MRIDVIEAASYVFLVMGPRTNWCLMRDGDAITLIGAAWPKDYPFVVDWLRQIGAAPEQVEAVVLTHAHPDHVGVVERFNAELDAVVHAHRGGGWACYGSRRTRPVRWYRAVQPLSGLVTALPQNSRIELPPASTGCCDSPKAGPFTLPGNKASRGAR